MLATDIKHPQSKPPARVFASRRFRSSGVRFADALSRLCIIRATGASRTAETAILAALNVIGETGVAYDLDVNYRTVKGLLERMGTEINCRFLGGAVLSCGSPRQTGIKSS